jgi:large subunit ribosomal protein L25
MSEVILNAYIRTEKPAVLRRTGFIPGALSSKEQMESILVKFEEVALTKLIAVHGPRAKVWVKLDGKKHFGVVDEIQKDSMTGKYIHVKIRMLAQSDEITIKLPVSYSGLAELEQNYLLLTHLSKIEVTGKVSLIPEHVIVDVRDMHPGDVIKTSDLKLGEHIRIHETSDTVLATVTEKRFMTQEPEPVVEAAPVEAAAVAAEPAK